MCTCASCEYTDSFSGWAKDEKTGEYKGGGFDNWPRGSPAGKRRSDADYAAHVAYSKRGGIDRAIPAFKVGGPPVAPHIPGLVMPIQPNALAIRWNQKDKGQVSPADVRPESPGKAAQHLPELNRQPEPKKGILYVMKKGKSPYMTVPEAAAALDCSESRILQWIKEERIPGAIKPARDWLVPSNAKRPQAFAPYERKKAAGEI